MSEMKTLKFPGDTDPREIVDAKAREDIRLLSEEKANKSGWTPDKYIGTDNGGNLIERDTPVGGGSGTVTSVNGVSPDENGNVTVEVGQPTDGQVETAVEGWLDKHPEATTTVADKSITTEKLADGSVIMSKLSESVTNEHYFDPYLRVQYTVGMINEDGTIDTSKYYAVTEYLPVIPGETIWLNGGLTNATAYYDKGKNFVSKQTISAGLNPYVVPSGAHYAIYQNEYSGGNVPFFPVRKKDTPKNECFSDLIFSPIKSEVSVGVTGDSNTLGYGLSEGELSWAELLMAEVEKTTSIRVLPYSRFAESFGAFVYSNGLNYRTGSQFSVWTDAAHIDLSLEMNYDSVFSWYINDVEIEGSSGLTSVDLDGEFSKITVKFTSGQAVNPVFTIPKTITHTNAAVTGVGAGNVTFPKGHDWLLLMVGTNDRNALKKDFLGNKVYSYIGKGTYVVPFPNHKEESINIITQAHRFNEYRNLMRDCGYEVIDCSDVNSLAFYDDTLYQKDRIHFNAKGHRIMCNMISGKMGMPVMLKGN